VDARRALVARAREARDVLPDALRARGIEVDVVALYETVAEPLSPQALERACAADYITFTSSSTVRFFLQAAGGGAQGGGALENAPDGGARPAGHTRRAHGERASVVSPATRIVSIGPVTSATLREHGLEPHVEADPHDVDGLVEALLADAAVQHG
jgi:uroporphyrinogen-III synthase